MPARKLLIWDIGPGPDLTAQITAIDYAEALIFDHLLLEDGSHLLTEDDQFIDTAEEPIEDRIMLETGYALRLESGSHLLGE